ncbi:MAG: hypothetical protein FJ221_03290 [Lentisphaerae bacterium]|nr:hypothetical protein [Lentisphaerota bacterium]
MRHPARSVLAGVLALLQGCATARLWEWTDPNERVWIGADAITEQALQARGIDYQVYSGALGNGFLVRKNVRGRLWDYQLRALGTPVTLVLDAATVVVIIGAFVFVHEPAGTVKLIEKL